MGRFAKQAVEAATASISSLLGCSSKALTFTSGATESNNIVVLGSVQPKRNQNIVICPIDHKSTLAAARELENRGIQIRRMAIDKFGRINLEHLDSIIDEKTALVSLSYVNSEIGTIQDLENIGAIVKRTPALLHIDAAQAVGKLALDIRTLGVDCVSLSAHKMFGPKGIGALYLSDAAAQRLRPLTFGGGQFRLRSGTIPTQLVVGFGVAARRLKNTDINNSWNSACLRRRMILETLDKYGIIYQLNSPKRHAVPHILNISIPGVRSETIINSLPRLCIASGSTCNSHNLEPSHVIMGIGYGEDRANSAIRFSFNADTDITHVLMGARIFAEKIQSLLKLTTGDR